MGAPVILVATANEAEGARHLRSLGAELNDIVAALDEAKRGAICEVVTLPDATPEQVMRVFQSDAYRDRVAILHFAGHAGPEGLLFETADGSTAVADAGGLAAFLGCQRALQLVVLNACATRSHVDALRDAGVGAVVATSKTVEDAIAHEFAVLLYQGLGSGAGIKRAYDEAAAGVRFKHGAEARGSTVESMHASAVAASQATAAPVPPGPPLAAPTDGGSPETVGAVSRDINRKPGVTTDDGRWPWDLYFRSGAEEAVGPWALPEAAGNPLFGLPKLPESDKPLTEPFRHLRPFTRQHAELFFGRGKDIRELYDKVTSAASQPVILLYGATGVGKSSLLDAGLLPRLTGSYEVRYAPRDRTLKLLGTLMSTLAGDTSGDVDAHRVAEAWRAQEEKSKAPLFVVIDQIEEAYTTEDAGRVAAGEAARELDAFAKALGELFASDATRPRGRIVLGFRKEWLSDVKSALEANRVARTEHRLEQLSRAGVLEAITGPTRIPQRRMPTRLELEPGLDVLIADDLLANRASYVAPLLQILLATMWTDAPRTGDLVRFNASLYQAVQQKAKQLDDFLNQQLDTLRAWHAPAVESGLVLEFLRFYTTPKATSDEHTADEEKARYPNAEQPTPGLRAMCARLFLLVERLDDSGAQLPDRPARLAHDTLAPIVRERFDRSDLPGPRAKRILDGRSAEWKDGKTGTSLDEADLALVEAGEAGMRVWNDEEKALVAASRVSREKARRRRAWVLRGAIAAITVIAGFGVGSWLLYKQSQSRLADSMSRELGTRAATMSDVVQDVALLFGVASYEQAPTFEARRALFAPLARDPWLIRVAASGSASTSASSLAFTADGKRVLLWRPDAVYSLDVATGISTLLTRLSQDANLTRPDLDPDGTSFSAASLDSVGGTAVIHVWDTESGRAIGEVRVPAPNGIDAVHWMVAPVNAAGVRTVAVPDDNDLVLWDLSSGRVKHRLRRHTAGVQQMAFSSDGSTLATAAPDGLVIAWDVATGRLLRSMPGKWYLTPNVAVSHDNSTIAIVIGSVTADTLALWPIRTNRPPRTTTGVNLGQVAFAANDAALVVDAAGGTVRVYEHPLDTRSPLDSSSVRVLHGSAAPQGMALSPTGSRIAVLGGEGTVHVWDLGDRTVVRTGTFPLDTSAAVISLTRTGGLAAVGTPTGIEVWDLSGPTPERREAFGRFPAGNVGAVRDIDIGDSGRLLITSEPNAGDEGPRYRRYGVPDTLAHGIRDTVDVLAVDPLRPRVAHGVTGTNTAVVVDLASGAVDTIGQKGGRDPESASSGPWVNFSPRGDLLIVQPWLTVAQVWDLATKQLRDSITGLASFSGLLASEDGSIIGAADGSMVQFWRRGQHNAVSSYRWKNEDPPPKSIAISPNGALFALDDQTGHITIGDVQRGEPLGEIDTGFGPLAGIAFVDGGRALVAVSPRGAVARIVTDPAAWIERSCAIANAPEAMQRFTTLAPAGARPPASCHPEPTGEGSPSAR